MKKNIEKKLLLFAFIGVTGFSATAQKLSASKVPDVVKSSFAKQYPGAAAKWEKESGKFEAEFKKHNQTMSALFEADGTMTESEISIKVPDLPTAVITYVKDHYKGKTIKEGAKITKANGTINFEAEVDGKDLIFDAKGNFLKIVKN